MDFKFDRCLAMGTSKCSAKFDVVWMRNAKDIVKYIIFKRLWFKNKHSDNLSATPFTSEYYSLVPKRDKSILINLSKNVFSLPRRWQDENHYFHYLLF